MTPTDERPTDPIRDAFDRARLDDLRGALEIHGWLTGEDSKEALDEIERAWGEIERVTLARDIAETDLYLRTADASRPGLTEEQADAIAFGCLQVRADLQRHAIKRAILRVDRGETGPATAKEMPSVKPCPAFFGLAGSVYGAQPGDRCDACKRTRAEHGASQ